MLGENYKDVIVSQPPAMYNKPNNVSLENFKGILLCEKPQGLSFVAPGDGKAFVPPNPTGNPVGYGPTNEQWHRRERDEQMRAANYKKNVQRHHQYLSRHRKWLHSFAKQMKAMKENEVAEEVHRARMAANIREVERVRRAEQLREQSQNTKNEAIEREQRKQQVALKGEPVCLPCSSFPLPPISTACPAAPPQGGTYAPCPSAPMMMKGGHKKNKGGSAGSKPKWAMTADEAFLASEDEEEQLLEFAKGLDYDKFIADYTVAEALQVMRDRVAEIAKANNWSREDVMRAAEEDDKDDDEDIGEAEFDEDGKKKIMMLSRGGNPHSSETHREFHAAAEGGHAAHEQDWDSSSFRGRILRRAISKDALALADRILQNSPSMQKVYTRSSLARVLQKCAMDGNPVNDAMRRNAELGKMSSGELATATAIGPEIDVAPMKVTIGANATAVEQPAGRILVELQRSKERTQNLPYLYRCPAI